MLVSTSPIGAAPKPHASGWYGFIKPQFLGWAGICLVYFAIETHQLKQPDRLGDLVDTLAWGGTAAAISISLCLLYGRLGLERLGRVRLIFVAFLASLLASLVWFLAYSELNGLLAFAPGYRPIRELTITDYNHGTSHRMIFFFLWHAIGMVRVQSEATRLERERSQRLEQVLNQARIDQLRGQLNPHFLFNSLNSAVALIDEDSEAAKRMLRSFSRLLRDTLDTSGEQQSTLGQELDLVRRYVGIEKIRFEDDLVFTEEIDDSSSDQPIPPFLLLPLVENAIKHGMRTSNPPLKVRLMSRRQGSRLFMEVHNTGRLEEPADAGRTPDAGIGLANLRERLEVELHGGAELTLEEGDGLVVARLVIGGPDAAFAERGEG